MIPVPGYGIGTPYGRRGPYWSCSEDAAGNGVHTGVDYPAPTGARIVAARPGTVNHVNFGSAFGYHQFTINPGDGTRDFYAHTTTRPAHGTKVDAGDNVAKCGAEGNVTGAHLHFERHGTNSGGWSCSVHRDPAPSINYQPSGSGGSGAGGGGTEDDMPNYASTRATASVKLKDGQWTPIEWPASANDKHFDGLGILVGGCRYSATLNVKVTGRNGAVVDTSWTETESGDPVEESATATHGAFDSVEATKNGMCQDGRRLRARVRVRNGDATLEDARIAVLFWPV